MPGFPEDSKAFHFVHITTRPKGSAVDEHFHTDSEEFYYVIKGHGEMTVDGDKYKMEPGLIGLIKDGKVHAMKNSGTMIYRCWLSRLSSIKND